jgi:F-type H+-transporting ATPase subunit b
VELNWSTFLLEILNFLVLVWILKRFLYRPVMAILETRREKIEQTLKQASTLRTEADSLQQQYQGRLNDWALEKQHLLESLQQEIQTEKTKRLEQLQTELSIEREKADAIEQRHKKETLKHFQLQAHAQGARFAARLLNAVAGPELESRLFDLLLKTFDELDEERLTTLRNACESSAGNITLTSAYPLLDEQQKLLQQKLSALCEEASININYMEDTSLVAGLRICIGGWVLRINLQDELNGFAELSNELPIG